MATQTVGRRRERAATRHFARSAAYRLLSQATSYPSEAAVAALVDEDLVRARAAADVLGPAFAEGVRLLAKELEAVDAARLQAEHRRIFTHILSLDCPPCETVYTARHIFEETQELADIAGFYRAFGLDLAERERFDHISVELEFMQFLAFKEAYALLNGGSAKARVCRVAQRSFVRDHLGRWAGQFADRLQGRSPGGFYGALAGLIDAVCAAEAGLLRVRPEIVRVDSDWRRQPVDDACPAGNECPVADPGGRDGSSG